jgi:dethiobiotin synthetase
MRHGIFVTGTDTGVGKTYVTAAILKELRRRGIKAAAFKPIACGVGGRQDAKTYARLMDNEVPLDLINPIFLRHPLAPIVAAKLEHTKIDLSRVFSCYEELSSRYRVMLVEGAGGLLVPILGGYFVADLAKELRLPLLIVARLGLGTINHSLLTVRLAKVMGLKVKGVVLNDTLGRRRGLVEQTNIKVVPESCGVPLLGVMPHGPRRVRAEASRICRALLDQ